MTKQATLTSFFGGTPISSSGGGCNNNKKTTRKKRKADVKYESEIDGPKTRKCEQEGTEREQNKTKENHRNSPVASVGSSEKTREDATKALENIGEGELVDTEDEEEHTELETKKNAKLRKRAEVFDTDDEGCGRSPLKHSTKQKEKAESDKESEDGVDGGVSEARPGTSLKAAAKNAKKANAAQKPSSKPKNTRKTKGGTSGSKSNLDLLQSAPADWADGCSVPYSVLCRVFDEIERTSGRLDIQRILTQMFQQTLLKVPSDLLSLVYLASNEVAPAYKCIELGIGDSILIKAIGEASGTHASMVKQKYESEGDLGTVASVARAKQRTLVGFGAKPKPLLATEVLSVFRQIATTTGSLSQKWKVDKIKGLLVRVQDSSEAKYVVRGLQGKLRIGLAQSTVLISIAHALYHTPPGKVRGALEVSDFEADKLPEDARMLCDKKLPTDAKLECAVRIVKRAYSEVPSFDTLVGAVLTVPLQQLHAKCSLRPGMPVSPMLAKPTKSVQEVLKRLNGVRFTCEFKYDGERAQVHMMPDGSTKVFSRNLLDTSEKFPEVPLYVKEACDDKVTSFMLDTEVVAFNRETGQFVPFQVLSTRKKTEQSDETAKVHVIVQAFDLMYLNEVSLLDQPLAERRKLLHEKFHPVEGKFQFAKSLDHEENGDTTVLDEFLDVAVKGQCEGLMVKTLDENAAYEPSRRSLNWLKLKKDYLEGLGDSFDLVPLGAFHGKGKRTGVYGAYLLACYDPDTEEFQSVCKIGTGFSEEDLKSLSDGLNKFVIPGKTSQYIVSESLDCDVWFEAAQVWEIKAADLSKSSTHKGAIDKTGEAGRGIGLRFPRFERVRADKKPDQATSSDQILELYYAQDSIVGDTAGDMDYGI